MPSNIEDEGDFVNSLGLDQNEIRFVSFGIPIQLFVDFTIKLQSMNVFKTKFFLSLVDAVMDDDPAIIDFINRRVKKIKKRTLQTVELDKEKEYKQKQIFGLDEEEIEDIYTVLEREVEP